MKYFLFFFSSMVLLIESHLNDNQDCYGYAIQKWSDNLIKLTRNGVGGMGLANYDYLKTSDPERYEEIKTLIETPLQDMDLFLKKFTLDTEYLMDKGAMDEFKPTFKYIDPKEKMKPEKFPRLIACFNLDEKTFKEVREEFMRDTTDEKGKLTVTEISNFHVYYVGPNESKAEHHLVGDGIRRPDGELRNTKNVDISKFFGSEHFLHELKGRIKKVIPLVKCYEVPLPKWDVKSQEQIDGRIQKRGEKLLQTETKAKEFSTLKKAEKEIGKSEL